MDRDDVASLEFSGLRGGFRRLLYRNLRHRLREQIHLRRVFRLGRIKRCLHLGRGHLGNLRHLGDGVGFLLRSHTAQHRRDLRGAAILAQQALQGALALGLGLLLAAEQIILRRRLLLDPLLADADMRASNSAVFFDGAGDICLDVEQSHLGLQEQDQHRAVAG